MQVGLAARRKDGGRFDTTLAVRILASLDVSSSQSVRWR
jgi:hypothetical protein